ncbi:cytochrome p450, partial [Trifolium pratense]
SKGCLPTRLRLQQRHVSCPLLCPVCNQENEDDWHVLFGCEISKLARQAAGILQQTEARLQHITSASQLIHTICSTEDKETAGMFAVLAWVLWNNRNNIVWNGTNEPGRSLGIKARVLWEEWSSVQQVQQGQAHSAQQQHIIRWQAPDPGWYKCNVDAGFHQAINKTSTGWVLRDDMGRFVMAETTWMEGNCSIMEGECIALIKALEKLSQRGVSKVIFETDSKSVVDAVHRLHSGSSEFSFLIRHVNNIMLCNPNFKVKFTKRQANMVAHTLARAAISWPRRCDFETLPI